ncbi:MAG: LysM repeat protein, partial [Hyphomicrobiaceae bacterium]
RVARGDTLYHLSRRHGVSVNLLMTENRLSSTKLSVGQTLYLPYAR